MMPDASSSLRSEILSEIAANGPMPFARFMMLCLYHPLYGYYTRGIGGGGGRDYVTSSGIHRVYGALVARQAEEMWRRTRRPDPFVFVEFGPGEGRFAQDFLEEADRHEAFSRALQYLMVEPSPVLAARQRLRLTGRTPIRIGWVSESDLEQQRPFEGCLFANEVLDALPVHRVVRTPDGLREVFVGARDGELEERLAPLSSGALERFLAESGITPEPGQELDLNLAAPCWMSWALGLLARGYALIVDYGHEAADLYHAVRRRGTLLAYHRHRTSEDFLARPGEQDLTAHVDFTALRQAADRAGARWLGLVTQGRFLLALGGLDYMPDPEKPDDAKDGTRTAVLVRTIREREALKELMLPGRMGDRFRVLMLGVGEVPDDLTGLTSPWRTVAGGSISVPVGSEDHAGGRSGA
jgi:SAM-dependent MidA family methyltransferase